MGRPLLVITLLLVILAGCDTPFDPRPVKPNPTPVPPSPTRQPRPNGGTLTLRLTADPGNLNPWLSGRDASAQSVGSLIFSGLTKLDNHLQPQPDLATSWDVSDDGTSLTFHLREGVLWHDGQPFTAQDVVWSYQTLARLPASTPAMLHIQDTVLGVEAVEPVSSTVRFTLKRRYSPILADFSMPVLPSHILSGTTPDKLTTSPFNGSPVGTGPFAYDTRQVGQSVTLKANEKYYAGRPSIDRVAFLVAPDERVAAEALAGGTLLLGQVAPDTAEKLVTGTYTGTKGSLRGGAYDEPGYDYVAFNLRATSPFSDTRLRKAWALAIDKPGLVFGATGGKGDPVWTDVPRASWAYNASAPQLGGNPDMARGLLSEAGWTDTNGDGVVDKGGKPLEVTLYVRADDATRRKAAELMSEQLAKVGMHVKVQAADFNTSMLARLSPNTNPPFDFDVMVLGWDRLSLDPDPFALFHSSQIPTQAAPGLLNFTGFSAPEYDSQVIEGRSAYDFARRKEIYARTQEIIADQLPYYFLWAQKFGVVASTKLKGDIDFGSPRYLWNADSWWIEP